MNKVKTAVLTLGILALHTPSTFAWGTDDKTVSPADTVYNLESVSVTGSRTPMTLGASARIVTVLDSLAISSMPAQTVNDLLKYSVGVDVRQRGVMGMQTDISVRGGTCEQIAVLLNGINICDPQTGHNSVDFPVSTSDIDRIEILEGPAARVYGTSSLVGAINIVTKKPKENGGSVHLEGGSYGLADGGASFNFSKGKFSSQLSGNYTRSDGYTRSKEGSLNTDFSGAKAYWSGQYESSKLDMNWQLGFSEKDFGSNTFYSSKYDNQFEHTLKTYATFGAETKGWFHFKPSIYWNHGNDRFELFRDAPEKYPFNYHRTNVLGANLGADFSWKLGKTAFGAEIRNEDIISTNLGEPLDEKIGEHYTNGRSRTNYTLYLEHSVILSRFTASAGLSAVKNTATHEGFGFYPGIDASYRFSDSWKVYASYNTSLRMPSFTELYYSVGGYKADKNLNAEKMQALEGGLKFMKPGFRAVLSVYYHHGTDMIDWLKDLSRGEDAVWTSVNHTSINSLGEEISLVFDFPTLTGNENFFIKDVNLGYSHISQDKEAEENIQSAYALEYLKHKVVAQANFHIWNKLNLNLSYRWHDRVGSYELFENCVSTGKTVNYSPYSLVDCRLDWNAPKYRIYLEADNLLNKTYYDHGNIPQPGIWGRIGVVYSFGF